MAINYATVISIVETEATSFNATPPNTRAKVSTRANSFRTMVNAINTAMASPTGSTRMTDAEVARAYNARNSFSRGGGINDYEKQHVLSPNGVLEGVIKELRAL